MSMFINFDRDKPSDEYENSEESSSKNHLPPTTLAVNAFIKKVTTTIDNAYDVTLSISESDLHVIKELLSMKQRNAVVAIAFREITGEENDS